MEVVAPTGVTKDFADDMASMVPYTSVKMGRYEMFLRLFLRGGKSPTKKGDVEVNGEEMEVKSTISATSGTAKAPPEQKSFCTSITIRAVILSPSPSISVRYGRLASLLLN